jgi:hypothetical protein
MVGCVHRIHVHPTPETTASRVFPFSVSVQVPFVALEGADHMPGIVLLEWPREDLQSAIIQYIQQRGTFASVGTEAGDMILTVKGWLTLRAPDHYVYYLHLEADIGKSGKPAVGSYAADSQATGSIVRWTIRTEGEPIQSAVQQALDRLLSAIEADGPRLLGSSLQ